MNATLLTALLLQVVAIVLLRHRLGQYWLRHPVTLISLISGIYQGLSPVLLTFRSVGAQNPYRNGVQQGFINSATLLMSAGMLAFTIAYLMTCPGRRDVAGGSADIRKAVKALDWRWLTAACVPLAVLTYKGQGYNDAVPIAGSVTSVGSDLAATFFLVLVAVAAFSFLLKYGIRWFIPVLILQSLVLAAAGEQTPVIADAIALMLMLSFAGFRPSARQLSGALALTLIAVLAITGLRVEQGRSLFYRDSGLTARVSALGSGLNEFTSTFDANSTGSAIVAQDAARVDGVDFAGAILQSLSSGQPRLSAAYVAESLLVVVPSPVWSSKLDHGDALNPAMLEINDFGLQQLNFLPTLPGLYIGFLSAPWLIAFLAFIGLLCGWGERWMFRRCTPARIVLLGGAVLVAFSYEKGLPGMLVALRAAAVIAVIVKLIELLRGAGDSQKRLERSWTQKEEPADGVCAPGPGPDPASPVVDGSPGWSVDLAVGVGDPCGDGQLGRVGQAPSRLGQPG
jgi:hypothetical protein